MPEEVPPVVDELEVAPVAVEFSAASAWASAINCSEAVAADAPFAGVVAEVPDAELVVAGCYSGPRSWRNCEPLALCWWALRSTLYSSFRSECCRTT